MLNCYQATGRRDFDKKYMHVEYFYHLGSANLAEISSDISRELEGSLLNDFDWNLSGSVIRNEPGKFFPPYDPENYDYEEDVDDNKFYCGGHWNRVMGFLSLCEEEYSFLDIMGCKKGTLSKRNYIAAIRVVKNADHWVLSIFDKKIVDEFDKFMRRKTYSHQRFVRIYHN